MNTEIKRHIGNIGRAVGHDVSSRYSYIVTENELTNAWLQMHNDLGYPLMMTSKYRRAIIYNKEGLEKKIQQMITECVKESSKELTNIMTTDVLAQLNNIVQDVKGNLVFGKGSYTGKTTHLLAKAIGGGLVNGFFKVLDDITYKDDNRRR